MEQASENVFVSILRRPEGLFATLVERREKFDTLEGPDTEPGLQAFDPYIERIVPLQHLARAKSKPLKSVLQSWEALGDVQRLDETVLVHLVNVLLHSLPDETAGKLPPPLVFPLEPPVFRPTAARPRAYRGTKDRPPKFKQRRGMDLRPHLASPRDVNELLLRLAPFATAAGRLLKKEDVLTRDLPALVDSKGRVQDVYVSCLHSGSKESLHSLPPLFRRGFLFWRRGEPWRHVSRMLGLFWDLGLDKRAPLRRAMERLLTATSFSEAMEWGKLILDQPEERRTAFVELLVESGFRPQDCSEGLRAILKKETENLSAPAYRPCMFLLLSSLKKGGDPRFLLSGMELAAANAQRLSYEASVGRGPAPVETIQSLVDHTSTTHLAMPLWEACGKLAGFSRVLEEPPWLELTPSSARDLLYLLTGSLHEEHLEPALREAKWEVLRRKARELVVLIGGIPYTYQAKAIRHLKKITWYWDTPKSLDWALGEYLCLLPRICRSPFQEKGSEDRLLAVLTNLELEDWASIREAPDEVYRAFEKACRRDNDAVLVASGIRFLALEESARVTEAILNEPVAVMKTAERLGGLGRSLRREILNQWKAHPVMHDDLVGLPIEKLAGLLVKHVPAELSSAIPRKLKDHLAGRLALTLDQLERNGKLLRSALAGLRWRLLGHLCVERASQPLRPRSGSAKVVHAVRLYGQIDENRRALRKFLQAYFKGHEDYLRLHPRNREWLRRQGQMKVDVWLGGMEKSGTLQDGAAVRLHIELDPLEALRLGTYVGSCTGLGGSFAYSAAAVVLDLNKHVVYARNDEGVVLARQLIAISSEKRLVVFEVYPTGVSSDLKRLFRDFDRELAKRLGVEIYDPRGEDTHLGNVELLLSKDWWDDSAWDLAADEESTAGGE